MASRPWSMARTASSAVISPFSTRRLFTVSRRRLMKSQVRLVAPVPVAADAGNVEPVEVGLALHVARQPEPVTGAAVARVGAPQPDEGFPILAGQHVGRHHDGARAGLFGAPRQANGYLPFVRRVELEPHRAAARLDRLFDRGRGHRREHLQVVALAGSARNGELAVLVKGAVGAGGRQHDRAGVALAEQFQAQVERLDVDQAPRPELELQEALAVGAHGHFVVDAGRHVAEMRWRHVAVHHRLEVEDAEGFARGGDQLVERARTPHRGIGQALFLREDRGTGQQGTRCQEFEEAAAVGRLIDHVLPVQKR